MTYLDVLDCFVNSVAGLAVGLAVDVSVLAKGVCA